MFRPPVRPRVSAQRQLIVILSIFACVVLAIGSALVIPTIKAATPSGGTLSTGTPQLNYSAGPFAMANPSAQVELMCNAALPCDDYNLMVTVPAGYNSNHQVRVQISWPTAAADYDLYVYSNGVEVASAASSSDPEVAILPAVSANYVVRIVPFAPSPIDTVSGKITLESTPTNPPPGTGVAPKYVNYSPPPGSDFGDDAGEPSIGVNHNTGKVLFQSYLDTLRVTFDDSTSPASATWEARRAPNAQASLDPILFTDPVTGRTITSQLTGVNSLMAVTDDDGETFTPSEGGPGNSGVDHQTVGGGPFAPGALPHPLYENAVYYCSQSIATAFCGLSQDGGITYGPGVPIYDLTECGGLHGHVKVAPDGTVYVPNKGCGGLQGVSVSTDNGLTWTVRTVPGSTAGSSDPHIGIGANGRIYMGMQGANGHPFIATSTDRGVTWQNLQDVGVTFSIQNSVFPEVIAGDDDRAAFAFLGTPTGGNYEDTANFRGIWHMYVAHTYDAGVSWVVTDATPKDPVQRGSICTGGTTCGNDRNLLDFNDITVDAEGRVLVGYADGCIDACVNSEPNSFSARASIARQSSGRRLYAINDPAATNTPVASATNTRTAVATSTRTAVATNTAVPVSTNTALPGASNTAVPVATNTSVPVSTSTRTRTAVATSTRTTVPTSTRTRTAVATSTRTRTAVATSTRTAVSTNTAVPVSTNTAVPGASNTAVPVATNTSVPVSTSTRTRTAVATSTRTAVPTSTRTAVATSTRTAVSTNTAVPVSTNTRVPVATNTRVPVATNTSLPGASNTPVPVATNTAVPAATNTIVPAATNTSVPLATNTRTAVATSTRTAVATSTRTRTAVATSTRTAVSTNTAVPGASNTAVPVSTSTRTAVATSTAVATNTRTAVATSTRTVVATSTAVSLTATPVQQTATAIASATPCSANFNDVATTDYFHDGVIYLTCHGAISGYSDGSFRPYNNATRSQLVKIVVLAEGFELAHPATASFDDVPTDFPFYAYIETAVARGLISGYSDGNFRPYNEVTRGQITKIVVSAAGWELLNPATPTFSDTGTDTPFYRYIETAFQHGVISGYQDGTFRWGNNATRGQIAKIVYLTVTQP